MKFNQELDLSNYSIRNFKSGEITVINPLRENETNPQEQILAESFVIMPKRLISNWPPKTVADLTESLLQSLIQFQPELVLLGTGTTLTFPSQKLLSSLTTQGVGIEVMDTAAACRTYNILMHEGRNVAAAMLQCVND